MSNITIITGNLAANPILKNIADGTPVCGARLIHSESYFDRASNEWKDGNPVAIDLELWGKSAEAFEARTRKGTELFIESTLVSNNNEKEDGSKVYGHRLRVTSWKVISRGKLADTAHAPAPADESTGPTNPAAKKTERKATKKS